MQIQDVVALSLATAGFVLGGLGVYFAVRGIIATRRLERQDREREERRRQGGLSTQQIDDFVRSSLDKYEKGQHRK